MKLLAEGKTNHKLNKNDKKYLSLGLSLAPAKESGYNVCTSSSAGCRNACIFTAGRGNINSVQNSRRQKTKFFFENRPTFLAQLDKELRAFELKAKKNGQKLCCRLNVFSDIMWENFLDLSAYDCQFYDYTKHYKRALRYVDGKLPLNYYLTFSHSENNLEKCLELLSRGMNVSAVFDKLPKTWNGYAVFDGDKTDLRFKDKFGIVGLKTKGRGKQDKTGFVLYDIRTNS